MTFRYSLEEEKRLRRVRSLSVALMTQHDVFPKYSFSIVEGLDYLGMCFYPPRREIWLDQHFALHASEDLVKETILHEIAHALTKRRFREYPSHSVPSHGKEWKAVAREIGTPPFACATRTPTPLNPDIRPEHKWIGTCTDCGWQHGWIRKPRDMRRSCGSCSPGKFDPSVLLDIQPRT